MELSQVQGLQLMDGGVVFRYLVFSLELKGQQQRIVRALNYQPEESGVEERIIAQTKAGLDEAGFFDAGGEFGIEGGGSLARNPYYRTLSFFGADTVYGAEKDREGIARMVKTELEDHEVSWFDPDADPKPSAKKAAAPAKESTESES